MNFSHIAIRRGQVERDLEYVKPLNDLISGGESHQEIQRDLNNLRSGAFWIAEVNGYIHGFCSLAFPFWNQVGIVFHLVVSPSLRSQGIGTQLLQKMIYCSETAGLRRIAVQTAEWNQKGIAFYKRHEFRVEHTFLEYFGSKNSMVWLSRSMTK